MSTDSKLSQIPRWGWIAFCAMIAFSLVALGCGGAWIAAAVLWERTPTPKAESQAATASLKDEISKLQKRNAELEASLKESERMRLAAAQLPNQQPPPKEGPKAPSQPIVSVNVGRLMVPQLAIGQVGFFSDVGEYYFEVVKVISPTQAAIRIAYYVGQMNKFGQEVGPFTKKTTGPFLVDGPTTGMADGAKAPLQNVVFEVYGTQTLAGGETLFVLRVARLK